MGSAIAEGFVLGLMLASFFGPIFFLLLDLGVNKGIKPVFYLSIGVCASDFLTVVLMFFVLSNFLSKIVDYDYLFVCGGLILIGFGLVKILKRQEIQEEKKVTLNDNLKIFWKGFFINSLNPSVFLFWFGSVLVAKSRFSEDVLLSAIYFMTALFIVVLTDFGKGFLAVQLRKYINPNNLGFFSKLSGFVFIFYGLKLIYGVFA